MIVSEKFKKIIANTSLAWSLFAGYVNEAAAQPQETRQKILDLDKETLPSSLNQEAERLKAFSNNEISWRNLTKEEQSEVVFIEIGLNGIDWLEVVNSLDNELLEDDNIQSKIIERLSAINGLPKTLNQTVLEVLSSLDSFKYKLLNDETLISKRELWNAIFVPSSGYFKDVREKIGEKTATLLINNLNNETLFEIIPVSEVVSTLPQYNEIILNHINSSPLTRGETLTLLKNSNLSEEVYFDKFLSIIDFGNEKFPKIVKDLFISRLSPASLENKDVQRALIKLVSSSDEPLILTNVELLNSEIFIKLITDSINKDINFANKLDTRCFKLSSQLSVAVLSLFKEPHNLEILLGYASDIRYFEDIPPLSLKIPELNLTARETCNKILCEKTILPKQLPSTFLKRLVEYGEYVPEILRIQRPLGGLKDLPRQMKGSIRTNSLSFANLLQTESAPTYESIMTYAETISALRILDIEGLNRFDNSAEIIRNRYAFATKEEQKILEKIMTSDFFSEADIDMRPRCLVLISKPHSDHNEVFSNINSGFKDTDFFDRLTVHYKLVYYEVSSNEDIKDYLKSLSGRVDAELAIFAGHGTQESITLNKYGSSLRTENQEVFGLFRNVIKPKGTFILISCSTGSDKNDLGSIHSSFVKAIPECRIIAPRGDTMLPLMELGKDGEFKSITYVNSDAIVYDPDTKNISIEKGRGFLVNAYLRLWELNKAIVFILSTFLSYSSIVGIKKLIDLGFKINNARIDAIKNNKQKLLFPSFWEKSICRRFLKELFTFKKKSEPEQ